MQQRFIRRCTPALVSAALVAVSAWGLGSADLARAATIAGAVHEYDANQDTDGDATWEDLGSQADHDWTLSGPAGPNPSGPVRTSVSSSTTITHAYDFDGVDDTAIADGENRDGNHDTTFELWFRPDQVPTGDVRTIFEHGNSPRGVSFGLSGDTLLLAYAAGGLEYGELTFDLSTIGIADFIQAVGVIDDTNDQLRLYVNGGNEQTLGLSENNNFTSNDEFGLASNQSRGGGGQNASAFTWSGFYDGQIALLREYRTPFGLSEAQQNYAAISSTPGDFDGDTDIDGTDLLLWQRGGSPLPWSVSDLALWEANFGSNSSTVAALSVPEPSTAAAFTCLLLAAAGFCRRQRLS